MRIAIVNSHARRIGGVESYLDVTIPALVRAGNEVAFFCEYDRPLYRSRVSTPDGTPVWCTSDLGADRALAKLREWKPDLIYAQGLNDPALEDRTIDLAPAVLHAHDYR